MVAHTVNVPEKRELNVGAQVTLIFIKKKMAELCQHVVLANKKSQ